MTKKLRESIRKLARNISKREGKKHEASFGDIEEILKDMAQIEAERVVAGSLVSTFPTHILYLYTLDMIQLKKKSPRNKK